MVGLSYILNQVAPLTGKSFLPPSIPSESSPIADGVRLVWLQRKLVFLVALSFTLVFSVYAFIATPTYQAKAVLRPSSGSDLDELNRSGFYSITPEEALRQVTRGLDSYANRLAFFHNNLELFGVQNADAPTIARRFEAFDDHGLALRLPVNREGTDVAKQVVATFLYYGDEKGAEALNRFIEFVLDQRRMELQRAVEVFVASRVADLVVVN